MSVKLSVVNCCIKGKFIANQTNGLSIVSLERGREAASCWVICRQTYLPLYYINSLAKLGDETPLA